MTTVELQPQINDCGYVWGSYGLRVSLGWRVGRRYVQPVRSEMNGKVIDSNNIQLGGGEYKKRSP